MLRFKDFILDEDGVGVVEMVLIVVEIFTGKRDVFCVFCNPFLIDSVSIYTS